jgi:hypothetical protein
MTKQRQEGTAMGACKCCMEIPRRVYWTTALWHNNMFAHTALKERQVAANMFVHCAVAATTHTLHVLHVHQQHQYYANSKSGNLSGLIVHRRASLYILLLSLLLCMQWSRMFLHCFEIAAYSFDIMLPIRLTRKKNLCRGPRRRPKLETV